LCTSAVKVALQGISLFSKKLGSVGGVGGVIPTRAISGQPV
jgi:hypothetical protein